MITGQQIRAARAMLKWSAKDLSAHADLSWATIQRMEAEEGVPNANAKNVEAVKQAFEKAGIEFLPDNGVRLR
jgi:ribosome-binding protein aMBF1 (putative translation factor)